MISRQPSSSPARAAHHRPWLSRRHPAGPGRAWRRRFRPPRLADSPADASPMDEPLRLLAEAKSSFEKVTDYTCTLVKKERINGELTPENVIAMSVRTEPFGVDLRWLKPQGMSRPGSLSMWSANTTARCGCGSAGLLGAVGFISMDPADPRCQKTSRHAITEAGIGNLIERFIGRLGTRTQAECHPGTHWRIRI